ncbi:MAG: PKD domain-containing protein, partial [Muribaculaceae bacterium]|nr:PKD domain-containing protein [Muribaculaceae bacterium]
MEERVQLASALATSDIWLCNPTDNPGELFIRPNSYNADIPIYAEFDFLRATLREEYEEVSLLPKEEFGEIFNSWAQNISDDYYNFLISDHLDRANHCMDAEPFCTSDVYTFPSTNSGYSWSGPDYGCLGSSPTNKHSFWYYMRIGVAGNITIKMEAPFDIDFALWGPFTDQTTPCPTAAGQTGLLTSNCTSCPNNTSNPNFYPSGNLHDCSFSAQAYEYAHVVNGQVGQYYILLITNYNGGSGNITFQKYAGDGETDCGILPPLVNNEGPYCVGETIHLSAQGQTGASYSWTGPGNYTSNQQNPTRPNCTMAMAGTYTCTITVGTASNSANTEVVIYPDPTANFNYTSVCKGTPTQFTSTSTTNPSGQTIQSYQWNFGDGQTGSGQSVTHTYAQAGNYQVTHTVSTGNGHCTDQKTQTVPVYAAPIASATAQPSTVIYGGTATLTANAGATGTFNFHWEPANMVVNPDAQTTQTVPLQATQTYTVTVTNPQGGCSSTAQVTVSMEGSNMTAMASADQYEICEGESTTLHAQPSGGTGNYTFNWTPANTLNNANIQDPVATPPVGETTYTCAVSDGITNQNVSVTIMVHPNEVEEVEHTICENDIYDFYGENIHTPGVYEHHTQTEFGCDKLIRLHLYNWNT